MNETWFTFGLVTGFLGFAHCAGMCGGICAALTMSRPDGRGFLFLSFYQLGRITTYTLLGFAGASLGGAVLYTPWFSGGAKALLIASDLAVILLGLVGLGVFPGLSFSLSAPSGAGGLMARIVRLTARIPAPLAALVLGLTFGLIPCGFLYPVLLSAIQTGEPLGGALTMLGFGLGTAPALLVVGGFAGKLRTLAARFMMVAWMAVILMGSVNLVRHFLALGQKAPCCGG